MSHNSTRLARQVGLNFYTSQRNRALHLCANCRVLASQHRSATNNLGRRTPPQQFRLWHADALRRSSNSRHLGRPTKSHQRTFHLSNREAQAVEARDTEEADEVQRIKTLFDYFPRSLPKGPPPAGPFAIDLGALHKEFLQLQASAHPDRHPAEHKARAETLSALLNEAYNTLRDPLRRAQYILSLKGVDVANDETGKVEDQQLLMQVMEAQEGIEEAQAESDLEGIRIENEGRLGVCLAVLENALDNDDIETAREEAVRLRYFYNIKEGITNWEPGKPVTLVH